MGDFVSGLYQSKSISKRIIIITAPTDRYMPPFDELRFFSIALTSLRKARFSGARRLDLSMAFISSKRVIMAFASAEVFAIGVTAAGFLSALSENEIVENNSMAVKVQIGIFFISVYAVCIFFHTYVKVTAY